MVTPMAWSDDGGTWSVPKEISGFSSSACTDYNPRPGECDSNQFSYPTVAPDGTVYVSFENFNTPGENQLMLARSTDGGLMWSTHAVGTSPNDRKLAPSGRRRRPPRRGDGRGSRIPQRRWPRGCPTRARRGRGSSPPQRRAVLADPSDPWSRVMTPGVFRPEQVASVGTGP
jgi:hypothetical protein